jgi:putative flippase GtrA
VVLTRVRRLIARLAGYWAFRSWAVGAVAMALDVSLVLTGVELLGLPRVPCVVAGVTAGGTVGFLLNRRFAFRNQSRQVGSQAAKYAALVVTEVALHTGMVTVLVHHVGLHYLASKFSADFVVFTGIHLLAMRYLIFGPPTLEPVRTEPYPPAPPTL